MNIGFHSNQLSYRGTEIALFDYAYYCKKYFDHTPYIFYPAGAVIESLEKFKDEFDNHVIEYKSFEDFVSICKGLSIDLMYWIKAGHNDGMLIPGVKNVVHAVFNPSQPHGDVYACVSEYLAKKYNYPLYVPHIVQLPDNNLNYRETLAIPENATVIGRYGGYDQLNIPYIENVVRNVLNTRDDIYFLFMNTRRFNFDHPRCIYVDGMHDMNIKRSFINTCDAMLHGRQDGETFGLAVSEFLYCNKPVITTMMGDISHVEILGDKGIYYTNELELNVMLRNFSKHENTCYSCLVTKFNSLTVMNKFKETFLS